MIHRPALEQLTLARIREFVRQPEALFWVFGFPVLLALGLGFAFREKGPETIPIGVSGARAEALAETLGASPALRVRVYPDGQGRDALRTGRISLLVEAADEPVFRFDPTRPESRLARLEADAALQSAAGRRDPIEVRSIETREPGARYIDFLIPGLLGLNLMGTGMWGVGFSIATARMQKLLKRLVATPMRKSEYLLSHVFSRLLFLVLEVIVLVGFGWWVFDVAVRGSLAALALVSLLGALAFAALGLLVASRAQTLEGVSGIMNLVMVPMWVMSGVFFSVERFPDGMRPWIKALPLTALNDALRAIINEARPLSELGLEVGILVAWGLASFAVALAIFKWR
ncbi:MAG TPA: ABC transporter permease [Thermoanaerobaculia bacterium]|nr:ABC transporter permease [Thermoanaerobaculia bacterium]